MTAVPPSTSPPVTGHRPTAESSAAARRRSRLNPRAVITGALFVRRSIQEIGFTRFTKKHYRAVGVAKSVLDVSSPVAKASAAALISDCVCARATAARAVASPVCADVASVSVPTPWA